MSARLPPLRTAFSTDCRPPYRLNVTPLAAATSDSRHPKPGVWTDAEQDRHAVSTDGAGAHHPRPRPACCVSRATLMPLVSLGQPLFGFLDYICLPRTWRGLLIDDYWHKRYETRENTLPLPGTDSQRTRTTQRPSIKTKQLRLHHSPRRPNPA